MRLAAPELPPMIVAFGRVAIAALILVPFAGRTRLRAMRYGWRDYGRGPATPSAVPVPSED